MKKKITHIITGLNVGGAETMLFNLLKHTDRQRFEPQVISLTGEGFYSDKIRHELGIEVYTFNLKSKRIIKAIKQCMVLCKETDVIQSWMYHSNFLGLFLAKILRKKIVWGIHHSNLNKKENKRLTIYLAKISGYLSKYVDQIVSCGSNVKTIHIGIGYSEINHQVIVNGFDIKKFNLAIKNEYYNNYFTGTKGKKILLHVGRWDPLKDYSNLLKAIALLRQKRDDWLLFLVGNNLENSNLELMKLLRVLNIEENVVLLGKRTDIPQLMAAANVFVLSSSGEGLPNVLGEALASGTCCITTDVGDCGNLVGEQGVIVPARNAELLSEGINKVLEWDEVIYETKRLEGRRKIEQEYEITNIVKKYERVYGELLEG